MDSHPSVSLPMSVAPEKRSANPEDGGGESQPASKRSRASNDTSRAEDDDVDITPTSPNAPQPQSNDAYQEISSEDKDRHEGNFYKTVRMGHLLHKEKGESLLWDGLIRSQFVYL